MNHENVHEYTVSMFIFVDLHCYFLGRLIPSPSILSKFVMDDGANDESVSEMDGTTQDASNDMETDLDQARLNS
jgi:hypothetical protein